MPTQNIPQVEMYTIAQYLASSGAPLYGCTLGLYTNVITLTPQTAIGDLVEATFTGYSSQSCIALAVQLDGSSAVELPYGQYQFLASADPSPAETIYGYFMKKGGALVGAWALPTPTAINVEHDGVLVDLSWMYSGF